MNKTNTLLSGTLSSNGGKTVTCVCTRPHPHTHTHMHKHTFWKESKIRRMIHQLDPTAISRSLSKSSGTPHLSIFKMQLLCSLCVSVGFAYFSLCCFCAFLQVFLLFYLFWFGQFQSFWHREEKRAWMLSDSCHCIRPYNRSFHMCHLS